jgi:hypothetical protein
MGFIFRLFVPISVPWHFDLLVRDEFEYNGLCRSQNVMVF